jgi:hypothetical protein
MQHETRHLLWPYMLFFKLLPGLSHDLLITSSAMGDTVHDNQGPRKKGHKNCLVACATLSCIPPGRAAASSMLSLFQPLMYSSRVLQVIKLDHDFGSSFSGVLANKQGQVRAIWASYSEQISREEREWCAGLPVRS